MNKKVIILFVFIILLAGTIFFYFYNNNPLELNSFEATPPLFKIVLNKGETIDTSLNIKNLVKKQNFTLNIGNLNNIVSLETKNITLDSGESVHLKVYISGLGTDYGTHMGHISISNEIEEEKIPFVVSVHTPQQLFAINLDIASENKQLTKKDTLTTNIKFFNLYDDNPNTLDINYKILNIDGETIFTESEQITIGSKSSFTKKFYFPENIVSGEYVFVVSLDYLETITTSSYLFSIIDKKKYFTFLNTDFLAWIVALFVGITFILILFMLYERSTLFSQLKKQQHAQLKSFSKHISKEKKKRLAKAKTEKQKKKIIEELQDAKNKIVKELKKQQKHQFKELKKLEKKKGVKEKKKKLIQWRNESYPKALKDAQISTELKSKLAVLENAYDEGFIKKKSYMEGVSNIKSADKKIKDKYL